MSLERYFFLVLGGLAACDAGGADSTFWDRGVVPADDLVTSGGGPRGSNSAEASTSVSVATTTASSGSGGGSVTMSGTTGGVGGMNSGESAATSSTGTNSAVTWTALYTQYFGSSGVAACSAGGGCHTKSKSGFKCGTTKDTCYDGLVSSGYLTPGSGATSSPLVDPSQSPLCGADLGGNMPVDCSYEFTSADVAQITQWLQAGGQNN